MTKVLLIIGLILFAPLLIAIVLGVTAFLFKLALAAGVIALAVVCIRKVVGKNRTTAV